MRENKSRSLFWPVVMIIVGVIWLLGNLGIGVPSFDFLLLLRLWPLLLVVVGINLIIGRRWPLLRAAVVVLAIGGALAYIYLAPQYGLVQAPEIQHAEFAEPLGETESAVISIGSSIGRISLEALSDSDNLFEAELDYLGEVEFAVEGETQKTISLNASVEGLNQDLIRGFDEDQLEWTIGISPNVPVRLEFTSGVGQILLDLSELALTGVEVAGGVGQTELRLPAQDGTYLVEIRGGVGELLVVIAEGAAIDLQIDGGVGNIVIEVPEDAGVEVRADLGVGNIDVPSNFLLISGGSRGIGSSGTWRSPVYEEAEFLIEISFNGGVGNLEIR